MLGLTAGFLLQIATTNAQASRDRDAPPGLRMMALASRDPEREYLGNIGDISRRPERSLLSGVGDVERTGIGGDNFGPGNCVSLTRSAKGTCVINTHCGSANLSQVEFAFVCYNPGTSVPHALHSFGMGGFDPIETFDSSVQCARCSTVQSALSGFNGGLNWARSLPLGGTAGGALGTMKEMSPSEAAFYGPKACVAAFRSPAGTCIVQTRCAKADLSTFDIGITCLDKSGDYTRYLFGKGAFENEETFDTRIECEVCLGVGAESGQQQVHGVLPKQLVEDVNLLKDEVLALKLEVRALQGGGKPSTGDLATPNPAHGKKVSPDGDGSDKSDGDLGEKLAPAPAMAAAPAGNLGKGMAKAPAMASAPANLAPAPSIAAAPARASAPSMAAAPSHAAAPSLAGAPSMAS